jgi:Flp pilus assembly protein TadD
MIAAHLFLTGSDVRRAIEVGESGLRIQPGNGDLLRLPGLACGYVGRFEDALRVLDEAVVTSNRHPVPVAYLAVTQAKRGEGDKANVLLDELLRRQKTEIIHARLIGHVLMELGRVDEAFVCFDQAVDNREWLMAMWGVDRRLEPIRSDPGWERIRQRIGIPN